MSIPQDMKAFNENVIAEFRAHGGKLGGRLEGSRVLLLTTTGARTGTRRTVVIGYRPFVEAYAVIASNNGAPKPPHWYHNLMADPRATVEVGAEKFDVSARVAEGEEREQAARSIEYLGPQQERAGHEIPVILLERI